MALYYRLIGADIIGLIISSFLLVLLLHNDVMEKKKSKRFIFVTVLTILIIVVEIIANMVDCFPSSNRRMEAYLLNVFGFFLMYFLPVFVGILHNEEILKHKLVCFLPACVGTIIDFSSIWTGWVFWIDMTGKYHRGNLYCMNIIVSLYGFVVFLYAHIKVIKEYDKLERIYLRMVYMTVIGVVVAQVVIPQLTIIWSGVATSEMLYYIFLRELQLKYDVVTNLLNRACFEKHLLEVHKEESLFFVVFDVNNLKYINDNYGHEAGDQYLYQTAKILKQCYKKYGRIYRTGGDEFIVIAQGCAEEEIQEARQEMFGLIEEQRRTMFSGYYIANAYCQYDKTVHTSIHECLKEADSRMYEDKKSSKRRGDLYATS